MWENGGWHLDDMTYQAMGDAFERKPLVEQLNAWIADVRGNPDAFKGE